LYNNAISSSDPQAIEKLTEKLARCEQSQEVMKGINAYFRSHGTCQGAPGISDTRAAELDAKIARAPSYDKQPYPSWALQNNSAEIRRLTQRIGLITQEREVGFAGWEFTGGSAEANTDMNRLQLFFNERPSAEQCTALKSHGFKWAPSQGAWQRQLNDNAIYAAGRLDFVKPTDGRSVREHQPKAPARDTGAR